MRHLAMAALIGGVGMFGLAPAARAGCLGGAAVGGVVGHVAGHHALLGAAAGCAIGHHRAVVRRREQAASQNRTGPGRAMDGRDAYRDDETR